MAYGIWDGTKVIAAFTSPMTVRSNHPIFSSDTLSLKRLTYRRTAQRWEIDTKLSPLHTTANELFVNFVTKGHGEVVKALMPQNVGAKANLTMTATMTAEATAASESSLWVQAVTSGNGGKLLPKGTFIQFATESHTKVYMLTQDTITSSLEHFKLHVYPQLRKAVVDGQGIRYKDDIIINMKYDTDTVIGMVYEDGILMDNGSIKLIEAV
jgi:hypothetical protein